jgi:hypothetical protein
MQVTAMKKELAELKARLKVKKDVCKTCGQWECGYCGVSHWKTEQEIGRLEKALAAVKPGHGRRSCRVRVIGGGQ